MTMKDWTVVFKTSIMSRASIVKGVLAEHDISSFIVNKKDSTLHFSHGQVEVLVPNDVFLKALKIVNDEIKFG